MISRKRPFLSRMSWQLKGTLVLCFLIGYWLAPQHAESSLTIYPATQGISTPDGFAIWHSLAAQHIHFKSITLQKNGLLIKFDSHEQGVAARQLLCRELSHDYIIALQQDKNSSLVGFSRLHESFTGSDKQPG